MHVDSVTRHAPVSVGCKIVPYTLGWSKLIYHGEVYAPKSLIDLIKSDSRIGSIHNQIRSSIKTAAESSSQTTRYHQILFSSRRARKRIVFKYGDSNVVQGNVAKLRRRYFQDIFTTLVDVKWRWTIFAFAMSFIGTWSVFAGIWWLIAYTHNDLPGMRPVNKTFIPCVAELKSVTTTFLFSVETQYTIGYGVRYVTDQCPDAILTLCIQCILGVLIQAFMVGIVFAKLSRPKKRAQTLLFSRNAVICH
ncbi:inward rectifier potassium channel irk-1-like, partial [Sitodiplosis mosellana]|uniref:inward rectifier potassium channel irk-1-like n=1 Tax=Sitodiplosis mosellana TaxID=263140 RepID=UPI00244463D2